jgi:D-alanyl-D-alanine carboxypeptidase/D-alanyl-D-alanine-endopeptidase (penicillin-binding protein 4)
MIGSMRSLAPHLLFVMLVGGCVHAPPPAPPLPPSFADRIDALLAPIEQGGDVVGALVLDAATGAPLYAHREHTRSTPASTMKVATTAAALAALGPEFRFHTRLSLQGTMEKHVFTGDLVIEPSGDPSFGAFRFPETSKVCDQIAAAFEAKGIKRWIGSVRLVDDAPPAMLGPGWAWDDSAYDFSAPPSAFVFRENAARLTVSREKDERCSPKISWNFESATGGFVANVQETLQSEDAGLDCRRARGRSFQCLWRHSPDICPLAASTRLSVDETLAVFRGTLSRALHDRDIVTGRELKHRAKTITTSDDDEEVGANGAPPELLIDVASPPLSLLVRATNKESLNLYAERLALETARVATGVTTYASVRTAQWADQKARGIEPGDFQQVDGSGLSRYNLGTAAALARILYTSLQAPYGPAMFESLPLAGVDGTLSKHQLASTAAGLVRAKTGTLTGQRAFVGVAERPADPAHPRVVFALMLGNLARPASTTNETFDRLAEILVTAPVR